MPAQLSMQDRGGITSASTTATGRPWHSEQSPARQHRWIMTSPNLAGEAPSTFRPRRRANPVIASRNPDIEYPSPSAAAPLGSTARSAWANSGPCWSPWPTSPAHTCAISCNIVDRTSPIAPGNSARLRSTETVPRSWSTHPRAAPRGSSRATPARVQGPASGPAPHAACDDVEGRARRSRRSTSHRAGPLRATTSDPPCLLRASAAPRGERTQVRKPSPSPERGCRACGRRSSAEVGACQVLCAARARRDDRVRCAARRSSAHARPPSRRADRRGPR